MIAVNKPRLVISFSGGRTSAVMTKRLIEEKRDTHELAVTFANTGQEHNATLDFVNECDKRFGWGVVWLEALIDARNGKGVRYKIVTYETASRKGEPFEAYIAKYGIPNAGSPQCTSRLKIEVINAYILKGLGWRKNTYKTAIGIRADESDRMSKVKGHRFIYPLVDQGMTKEKVIQEVRSWSFDLMLDEHFGNCTWCWKKSNRKLLTLAKHNPEIFDFPVRMEEKYGLHKFVPTDKATKRVFFRGHRSAMDILDLARKGNFEEFTDKYSISFDPDMDMSSGCGMSSCEIGH